MSLTGNDLRYIHYQLDALQAWKDHTNDEITQELMTSMVYPRGEANNFAFLDSLCLDHMKSLRHLDESYEAGTHWVLFLGGVYW